MRLAVGLALAAVAVVLVLLCGGASASPSVECPVCNVGVKGDSQRCQVVSGLSALCVGCAPIANISTINCGARTDGGRTFSASPCSTLLDDDNNCGTCGNKCSGQMPTCAGGKCNCTAISCDGDSYCQSAISGSCLKCPAGTARCGFGSYLGSEGDCSIKLTENPSHCGACYASCGPNEVCSGGVCKCGTNAGCTGGKVCVGNSDATKTCGECVSPTSDQCSTDKFCTTASLCSACPEGKADCFDFGDTGVSSDCEVDLLLSGDTDNCGACGVNAQLHSAMTCCKGKPKCGRFSNVTNPSDDDCNAAATCGFDEYCDEGLAQCVKMLALPGYPRGNCDGLVTSNFGGQTLNTAQYCTSCNQTISKAALVNGTCYQYDKLNCGGEGKNCSTTQICVNGKCQCDWQAYGSWLNHNGFQDADPDKDRTVFPAKGCKYDDDKLQLMNGWARKIGTAVEGFLQCAELVRDDAKTTPATRRALSSFTFANFSQPEIQAMACPGGAGFCNATFCSAVLSNITAFKPSFCSSIPDVLPYYAYCGKNMMWLPDFPNGDPTCASENVIQGLLQYSLYSFSVMGGIVQTATLLGCPGLEKLAPHTYISTPGNINTGQEAISVMGKLGGTYFVGAQNAASGAVVSLGAVLVAALVVVSGL